jgi:hypothetical protein
MDNITFYPVWIPLNLFLYAVLSGLATILIEDFQKAESLCAEHANASLAKLVREAIANCKI